MTPRTATEVIAAATAALTSGRDTTDVLDRLVRDSADVLGAQAVGLLIVAPGGDLELLAATSHQVAELRAVPDPAGHRSLRRRHPQRRPDHHR